MEQHGETGTTGPGAVVTTGLDVVVTTVASDSHTWNLVFLQLLLEELGHRVTNLGACVPDALLVAECARLAPGLIVVSSVNGHGFPDGLRVAAALRARPELARTPLVIGGKLGIEGTGADARRRALLAAGFDGVFEEGGSPGAFPAFLRALAPGGRPPLDGAPVPVVSGARR
ncbi:cobalamin B12-binding domain-containing protein [Streptomyces termitum]|uniref:cobalamin B12-binding domain-containing protein n=1 Tax=Streptomyces termitum TaxID=67368 RepID=UPI003800A8F7